MDGKRFDVTHVKTYPKSKRLLKFNILFGELYCRFVRLLQRGAGGGVRGREGPVSICSIGGFSDPGDQSGAHMYTP